MDPTMQINERVDVIATYHRRGDVGSLCVPAKMRWRNQEIIFSELALRHPTAAGKRMVHVFHVWDGINGYRLEFDAEALTWTLVSVISGENHA